MANRPFQNLSDRYLSKIKSIKHTKRPMSSEEFALSIESLVRNICIRVKNDEGVTKPLLEELKNETPKAGESHKLKAGWRNDYIKILDSYESLDREWQHAYLEKHAIKKIETSAYIRALFFRTLTTLSIGFSIMLIYFIAAKWGIPMPLSKLSIPTGG